MKIDEKLDIDRLITIDNTGMPKYPSLRQLQDKDIVALFKRDRDKGKPRYLAEVGVIYYLGDPKSPAKQQGLSDKEALDMAIENYNLPKDYKPDELVNRLIKKYYRQNITEAGMILEGLKKSIHLASKAVLKINEQLSNKLNNPNGIPDGEINSVLSLIDSVGSRINDIPKMMKSLNTAYENMKNEEEEAYARGGTLILSSQNADEEFDF